MLWMALLLSGPSTPPTYKLYEIRPSDAESLDVRDSNQESVKNVHVLLARIELLVEV